MPALRKFIFPGAVMVLLAVLVSCAGPVGPAGLVGPAGPAGPIGPQGPPARRVLPVTRANPAPLGRSMWALKKCEGCHADLYTTFMKSGHPWKLTKVVDGQSPDYPFTTLRNPPEGYTWNDIAYVIGGYNWKARFIDQQGYIITDRPGATVSDTTYLNQYNFANRIVREDAGWVTYHAGEAQLKYDCGTCHTTGYKPTGHQDGLEGIVGQWAEPGIQCEACHGPGSLHARSPYAVQLKIDRDAEACGACHRRGDVTALNAKGGFIEHHEQYEELFQSKHVTIDCVVCHDPHTGVVQLREAQQPTTRTTCENCHFKEAKYQNNPKHAT